MPNAPGRDRFESLRRSKDIAVVLGKDGKFCQFDNATGWPEYVLKEPTCPLPDGICVITETELRGITLRQLLATYEHVKRCCTAEGWTSTKDGQQLAPETVTLYDLCKYVIKPATEAPRCSFVELVAGAGAEVVRRCRECKHAPMARTQVYTDYDTRKAEEVACTQCAARLELGAAYWLCHRCQGSRKQRLCRKCAPPPAPVPRAELQRPLWFVSHWYGQSRSLPQLAEPRSHAHSN